MPLEVSPRVLTLCTVALLLATGASYYLLAEFVPAASGCPVYVSGIRMMTFNGRNYCSDAIDVNITTPITVTNNPPEDRGNSTSATFLGFEFSITPWSYGLGGFVLNTTIVEPGGSVFHGGTYWTGESGVYSNTWFTSDNESGIYAVPGVGVKIPSYPVATVELLVED